MTRGSKRSYSPKQIRMASHIKKGYEQNGVSKDEARERAWRTVNKLTGGAAGKTSSMKSNGTAKR